MRKIIEKIKNKPFLFFFLVGVIIFVICLIIWGIPGKGIILFGDTDLSYLFPQREYSQYYIWRDLFNNGTLGYNLYLSVPFNELVKLLSRFLNLNYFSYFYNFLAFFLFGISVYCLIRHLLKLKNQFVYLIIAVFSLLNPVIFNYHGEVLVIYSLAFINFALIFFVNIIREVERGRFKISNAFFIALFLTLANIYLQNLILLLYILILLTLLNLKFVLKNFRQIFKAAFITLLFYLGLNLHWLIPLVSAFLSNHNYYQQLPMASNSLDVVKGISKSVKSFNIFRLVPYYQGTGALNLYNRVLLPITYLQAALALGAIFTKKYRKTILICLILLVIFFPLLLGVNSFSQKIFTFAWDKIPLFSTFRTFTKFLFIFLYIYLFFLALSLDNILGLFKNRIARLAISISLLAIFIAPVLVYKTPETTQKNFEQDKIPDYYHQILQKDWGGLEGQTILMPQTEWLNAYDWRNPEKDSANIFPYFYQSRVLTNGASYEFGQEWENYNEYVNRLLTEDTTTNIGQLLALKNIKYLVLQNDILPHLEFGLPAKEAINSNIPKTKDLIFKENIGELTFYKLKDEDFLLPFYTPSQAYLINSPENLNITPIAPRLEKFLLDESKTNGTRLFIYNNQNLNLQMPVLKQKVQELILAINELYKPANIIANNLVRIYDKTDTKTLEQDQKNMPDYRYSYYPAQVEKLILQEEKTKFALPNLEFKKISPTEYKIRVHNAASSFPLVFTDTFDKGWKVYLSDLQNTTSNNLSSSNDLNLKDGQASKSEIDQFINENKISQIGPDFISKDFQGTIQNNNLLEGKTSAAGYKKPIIDEANHFMANGYANGWWVDLEKMKQSGKVKENSDGTIDFELTVEFGPQKIFSLSLILSSAFLILGIICLLVQKLFYRKKDVAT